MDDLNKMLGKKKTCEILGHKLEFEVSVRFQGKTSWAIGQLEN
jgi:hypothetical protein